MYTTLDCIIDKLFVDWDGEIIFCSNDWQKERKVGNLVKQSLKDIKMTIEKIKLGRANRMIRIGFGYHMYVPFIRIDLWSVGYRLILI